MSMDNEEIKKMFDKLQEHVENNIEEGKKDHREIRDWIRKLCDRMTSTENTMDNHLINSAKQEKSRREKISYIIAGIGLTMGIVTLYLKF